MERKPGGDGPLAQRTVDDLRKALEEEQIRLCRLAIDFVKSKKRRPPRDHAKTAEIVRRRDERTKVGA